MSDKLIDRIDDIVTNYLLAKFDEMVRRPRSVIDAQTVLDETLIKAIKDFIQLKEPKENREWCSECGDLQFEDYKKDLLEGLQ